MRPVRARLGWCSDVLRNALWCWCLFTPSVGWADGSIVALDSFVSGARSIASAVTPTGAVVVGSSAVGPLGETAAFRWTEAEGMTRLNGLAGGGGKSFSEATAVSTDGNVVVGNISMPIAFISGAYWWSASSGVIPVALLNWGTRVFAYGVSGNGNVVVGGADDGSAGNAHRAYRWTQLSGTVSPGTLAGGTRSVALGVNNDGSVIVGSSGIDASSATRAFLWNHNGGMVNLGVLPGLPSSVATAVNAAGVVVVGASVQHVAGTPTPGAAGTRAFRWTQSDGMVSLGTLNGGVASYARGVSADGSTVVGFATDGAAGNVQRAFRWSQTRGMEKVEDWLRSNGVSVPIDYTADATAVNGDGSVVVGRLDEDRAFVARVGSSGTGMISVDEFSATLAGAGSALAQGISAGQLLFHGMHANPLASRVPEGSNCYFASADAGRENHGIGDGNVGIAEIGACRRLGPSSQINLSLGSAHSRHALPLSGTSELNTKFALMETLLRLADTRIWATMSAAYQSGDLQIRPTYFNAGMLDASSGRPGTQTLGFRFRLDWDEVFEVGRGTMSPYLDLSRLNTRRAGYAEMGGGFAAVDAGQRDHLTQARVGATWKHAAGAQTWLRLTLEATHRFETSTVSTAGHIPGLLTFNVAGQSIRRDSLRGSVAMERIAGTGSLAVALNSAMGSGIPSYWVNLSYRVRF